MGQAVWWVFERERDVHSAVYSNGRARVCVLSIVAYECFCLSFYAKSLPAFKAHRARLREGDRIVGEKKNKLESSNEFPRRRWIVQLEKGVYTSKLATAFADQAMPAIKRCTEYPQDIPGSNWCEDNS